MLADLHPNRDGDDAGQANVCAKLVGKDFGMAVDRWLCRWVRWLVAGGVGSTILGTIFRRSMAAQITQALIYLLVAASLSLCLRASVVKSLLKVAGVIYYLLSISIGRITDLLIFGPVVWTVNGDVNAFRVAVECVLKFASGILLIVMLALQDAVPLRVCPQRVRVVTLAFAAIYKSGIHFCAIEICRHVYRLVYGHACKHAAYTMQRK